jgi:hypothetical protein
MRIKVAAAPPMKKKAVRLAKNRMAIRLWSVVRNQER